MFALLLAPLGALALAAPNTRPVHVPILRRSISPEERIAKLPHIMDAIRYKYGYHPVSKKRSTTTSTGITDEANDSSYSAVVTIGSPAQAFNLVLDTGSSDLWVATTQCAACSGIPLFDPSKSSSFKNDTSVLSISYGSGDVAGYVSQDTVTFSGFSMTQEMLSVAATSQDLLDDQLSGIMGLGFKPLSVLNTTPFWQTLINQNMLSSPVFSFYLARYIDQAAMNQAPGGTFTLGGTNTSLYSGSIEFINMPDGSTPSYWLQQVKTITVQGNAISVSSSEGLAAIDTGTTLIGAPSDITKEIWSNVPGSVALTGVYQGMYAFPCSTSVSVALNFGGTTWTIDPDDMNLGVISGSGKNQMCGGGVFDVGNSIGGGQGAPSFIIGDTFLKNVYTVFQANPASVGFGQLASGLSTSGGTSGSNPFTITGSAGIPVPSGSSSGLGNSASPSIFASTSLSFLVAFMSGFLITVW